MNGVRFLETEDPDEAEQVLRRAVSDDPDNREIAANLGFLYAKEILGTGAGLAGHARTELQETTNAVVLAAAGTALPNLAVRATAGRVVDPVIFDFASELAARARQLAPDDPDIQGLMPLIKYFSESQNDPVAPALPLQLPSNVTGRIRVAGNVQTANLIRKTEPQYPDDARNAGITGEVSMSATIGRDGTIQNLELISGHPRLVQAALQAAETWVYRPTLLNGAPVEVVTTITISFPPK
jgi:TonB family protein